VLNGRLLPHQVSFLKDDKIPFFPNPLTTAAHIPFQTIFEPNGCFQNESSNPYFEQIGFLTI